ncbi:MAG TPA: hypothetical protein IAC73_00600 [Candidatus Limadaptatus stercoripullorum]|uniref:Stage III sporulation protein AG n=1 Tax=Candidatus Limadaptatus stercoripullorum TaxID=2840846 RepID=A0A9D1SW70_9FIRM|nr:hypothetical protein [Candidatus Limadaptatus stercoripullorum]
MEISDERKRSLVPRVADSPFIKKLRGVKNIKLIAAAFILAAALLIYSTVAGAVSERRGDAETAAVMNDEEQRLAAVLSGIDGAGSVETMISRGTEGEITGVLVIAEGAEDITVMLRLMSAAATALGVDRKLVDVYSMK